MESLIVNTALMGTFTVRTPALDGLLPAPLVTVAVYEPALSSVAEAIFRVWAMLPVRATPSLSH